MEMVARTGGVICLWPLAYEGRGVRRETLRDWAQDVLEIKRRLGIEHVGLGTDGGGQLPARVKGYHDVADLRSLAASLQEVGLTGSDIAAFFGGNFLRVFRQCAG
jgi:microsomal dipeptidase-like Zn-dependent dipeptidase